MQQTIDSSTVAPQFPQQGWRKSSWSNPEGGDCVEVNLALSDEGVVGVRDSKNRPATAEVFAFGRQGWGSFVAAVKTDGFAG